MVRVAVFGAYGRMGALTCRAVETAEGLELAARIGSGDSPEDAADADVAVDFTRPDVVGDHVSWCVQRDIPVVVGTSGLTSERLDAVTRQLGSDPETGVVVVPNFSIGATLMMTYAAQAAAYFESVEIVELHHPDKVDAPSGTATRTAQLISQSRVDAGAGPAPDATRDDPVGARGGRIEGVPVHSVRARGLVAHQEVLLGNTGETLTIRHDMPDRAAAMPGVIASIRYVLDHPGLTVGLERVLGLAASPDSSD